MFEYCLNFRFKQNILFLCLIAFNYLKMSPGHKVLDSEKDNFY